MIGFIWLVATKIKFNTGSIFYCYFLMIATSFKLCPQQYNVTFPSYYPCLCLICRKHSGLNSQNKIWFEKFQQNFHFDITERCGWKIFYSKILPLLEYCPSVCFSVSVVYVKLIDRAFNNIETQVWCIDLKINHCRWDGVLSHVFKIASCISNSLFYLLPLSN